MVDIYTESELNKLDIYSQTNSFDCSVNYSQYRGKWFLDYVRINYNFHLLWLDDQYLAEIDNTIQFVITDFDMDQLYTAKYGKLINTKTGRVIRKILNGRSLGYCINGKFRSLTRLKKEVEKINQIKTPF